MSWRVKELSALFGQYTNKRLGSHRFYNYGWTTSPIETSSFSFKTIINLWQSLDPDIHLASPATAMSKELFIRFMECVDDYTPIYIGKGQGHRVASHIDELITKSHSNRLFQNVFNGHSVDGVQKYCAFPFLIVNKDPQYGRLLTEEQAYEQEIELISYFGRRDLGTGPLCNLTGGGPGTRDRLLSDAELAVLSAGATQMWQDPEYRARMHDILSRMQKERWQDPEYRERQMALIKGRVISEEQRLKQSERSRQLWDSAEYRETVTKAFRVYDAFQGYYKTHVYPMVPKSERAAYRKTLYAEWKATVAAQETEDISEQAFVAWLEVKKRVTLAV